MHARIVASGVLAGVLACVVPAAAQVTTAAPSELAPRARAVSAGIDVMATSAYVWRGFVPTAEPSVQPAPWIKIGPVTITSWANLASRGSLGTPVTEHDATIDYTGHRGAFALSAGYTNYVFPDASTDRVSHEFYAGVAHDSYFSPSVRVYRDVSAGHGSYVNASIAHSYAVPIQRITVTPSAAIGYNRHQWTERSTWSDLAIGVKATVPTPSGQLTLSPFITYSHSLARDLCPNRLYGGVIVSVK